MPDKDILSELSKDPLYRQTAEATDNLIGSHFVDRIKAKEREIAEEDADISKAVSFRNLVPNGAPVNTPVGPLIGTNPVEPVLPEELIEERSRKRQQQISGLLRNSDAWVDKSKNWSKPYGFNTGESDADFDRYYALPNVFKKLGYSPFRDNESLFNANTSWWDEFNRMASRWPLMAGEAMSEQFSQTLNPFEFGANTAYSADFEKNMRIATSSKEGLAYKAINLGGNSAFTFGILGEMILEGVAASTIGSVLDASGVGTPAGLAMQSAYVARAAGGIRKIMGLGKAVKDIQKASKIMHATENAWQSMDNIEKVRKLWDTSKKVGSTAVKDVFSLPLGLNTVGFGRDFAMAKNGVDKLNDFALMRKGVGSLYMDIREMNFAVSESRMEGGSVTNNLVRDLNQEYYLEHGKMAEGEDAERIAETAFKAGNRTSLTNAPIIYLTNKLVFGKAFRGFTPASVVRRELGQAGGDIIINESLRGTGKAVAQVVKGPKKFLMPSYWKQAPLGAAANLLRYTQANWSEGAQESIQDVIATGMEKYYSDVYHDPSMAGSRQALAAFEGGVKSQFSGQGAETFLSGFLMGALVGPVQNVVYQRGWQAVQKMKDPVEFAKIKKEQEDRTNMVVNAINKMDPKQYFSALEKNMVTQISLDKVMNEAQENNDPKSFHDAKGDSMFNHFHSLLQTGNFDYFVSRLEDLKTLSPKELQELSNNAPLDNNFNKSKDMSQRIDSVVKRAKQVQQRYKEVNERFKDDPDIFQYSNAKSPAQYKELLIKMEAYKEAKKHAIYANYGFDDTLSRMGSILDDVATINKPLAKTDSTRFTILFSKTQTRDEIDLLRQEAQIYETGTPDQKKKATAAKKRLNKLEQLSADIDYYQVAFKDYKKGKQSKAGLSNVNEALKDLKKSYFEYVQFNGQQDGEIVINSKIEPSFIGLRDYVQLANDADDFGRSINALHDPENFYKVADRLEGVAKKAYADASKVALASFKKYLAREDEHGLLNSIYDVGAFVAPESIEDLKKGNLENMKFFYIGEGRGQIMPDSPFYKEKILPILKKFKLFKEVVRDEKKDEPKPGEPPVKEPTEPTKIISDFEKALRKNNEYVVGVDPKNSKYYLIKNPETGKEERFERVSSILPSDFTGDSSKYVNATIAGTHVDRIGRQFFIDAGKIEYGKSYTAEDGTKWSPKDLIDEKSFTKLTKALDKMYDQYVTKGKMKILTTDGVLYDRDAKKKVAGTVDIMAIAENGDVSIFDFKTMKFGKYAQYEGRGDRMSIRDKNTNQLTAYDILLDNQYNINAKERKVIPFEIGYDEEGYIDTIQKRPDIAISYDKEVEKLIPRNRVKPKEEAETPVPKIKRPGIEGDIVIDHIEDRVMIGDARTIVQSEAYHERFYNKDGVYKTKNGEYVQIAYKGQVKLAGNDIVGVGDLKLKISKDKFAKNQGFKNWRDYEADAEYADKKLIKGKETVNLYDITYIEPKDLGITPDPVVEGDIIYASTGFGIAKSVAEHPRIYINGDTILREHVRGLEDEYGKDQIEVPKDLNDIEDVFLDFYMSREPVEKEGFRKDIQDLFVRRAKPGKIILTRNWFARGIATQALLVTDRKRLVELFTADGRNDPERSADYALKYEKEAGFTNAIDGVIVVEGVELETKLKKTAKNAADNKQDRLFDNTVKQFEKWHPDMLDEKWEDFSETDNYDKLSLSQINALKQLIAERKKDMKKGVNFTQLNIGEFVKTKKGEVLIVIAKTTGKVKLKNIDKKKKMEAPIWLNKVQVPKVIATVIGKRKVDKVEEVEEETDDIEFEEEEMTPEEIANSNANVEMIDIPLGEEGEEIEQDPEEKVKGIKDAIKNPEEADSAWKEYAKNCAGKNLKK